MNKKGNRVMTLLLVLALLAGLFLLLYPTVSDYWNSLHQTRTITGYAENVAQLDRTEYEEMWAAAQRYNRTLPKRENAFALTEEQKREYESLLNASGNGVMGIVEIPKIGCALPIYHGMDDAVLQIAVGHLEWSSLPVGGEGTHCVLSGHRGLPSARLFTNLDQLAVGDRFLLRVLDETLTYEVDQILIVEPQEVAALGITEGGDSCTLVTCTPYGINTHRLLVRGHRIESEDMRSFGPISDAFIIDRLIVTPVVAMPIILLLILYVCFKPAKRKLPINDEGELI